ncbi:MAG: hypothetical protein FH756_02145 [Firmicutes bacterium]|nr:hypothetical protein [Bacillota bacterium]
MDRKKLLSILIITVAGLGLLATTAWVHEQIQISAKRMNEEEYLTQSLVYFFLYFLLGILIEWKKSWKALQGKIKIHLNKLLLITSIGLLAISLVPPMQWYMWYGLRSFTTPFSIFIKIMQSYDCHIALSILSGILFAKSLTKELRANVSQPKQMDL